MVYCRVCVQLNLTAPKDLRSSLIQWINFVFLPEAVNRWAPCATRLSWPACSKSPHNTDRMCQQQSDMFLHTTWESCLRIGL